MENNSKTQTHDQIQAELFQYIWNNYPQARRCFWHTPNESLKSTFIQQECERVCATLPGWLRSIFVAYEKQFLINLSKRKAVGVLSGVTDLVLYWGRVMYMFDIKIGLDRLSESQKKFIEANELQGGKFYEINSFKQGKEIIEGIFNPINTKKSRCCGRCDGINDICVTDMVCELHNERGCELCYGMR